MKVLMLGWELPPHNSGGLGVACYQLCKALSQKGADIEFVLPYTAEHDADFMRITAAHPQDVTQVLKAGIAYDSFKYFKADGSVKDVSLFDQSAIYTKAVERIVNLGEFDIIHAHDWLTARAAIRAKEMTGKPLFVHFHSIEADRAGYHFGGHPMVREIEQLSMMVADKVLAVSQHTKDAIIREYNIPADKIEVTHNSIDTSEISFDATATAYTYLEAMKKQGYKVVASVGRLTIMKGLTNLLYAFRLVVEQEPKTMLLMVGAGEQYHELVSLSAQLGISKNVIFTGFLRGKQWRDAYRIADLFVMPSVSEPFGLTALEAVGYGAPALISKQSGVSEVINNCLKVDFWDTQKMADSMINVVRSDALRDELHQNAYAEYERLSWNDTADKILDHYSNHRKMAAA